MMPSNNEDLPDGLHEVAEGLRAQRAKATALELDRIKLRVMAQASRAPASRQRKGSFMRSKILTVLLALGLAISGGTAGVIAAGGGGSNSSRGDDGGGSAAKAEYRPGKGCGDKNHEHTGPPGNVSNTDCPPKGKGKVKGKKAQGGGCKSKGKGKGKRIKYKGKKSKKGK